MKILVLLPSFVAAATARAEQPLDFDRDVRPILEQHCFKCHGPDKAKAGLRLDQKPSVLKGGESGAPTVVPGNLVKSHLLKVVVSDDPDVAMPPKGDRLKPAEVARLQKWVETGAHWADAPQAAEAAPIAVAPDVPVGEKDRAFWSFVPPHRSEPPATPFDETARTRIDRFVFARLAARQLRPAPEASRAALLRRVTFDLTGLPPTPEELDAFVSDRSADAYERVVDRLLASRRFGERLASMWLPLARYGEDQAHQVGGDTKFFYPNAWRYRAWVIDAFNRDLPYDQFVRFQLAADRDPQATPADQAALGFLGLGPKYYNRDRLAVQADEWEDRVDTVSRTMLGLTVACARCHDHKFDPVSQRDYYALAGVFAGTRMVNKLPDGTTQKGELSAEKVDFGTVHAVEDAAPKDLNLFIRGNVDRKGPIVPRRFLPILSRATPLPFKDGSGRRELAEAIASRENPLTARVIVNRLWGVMFGQPIVLTPSNFGRSGQPPTNPELLDDLASRFMDNGWSVKTALREMALSATYRQASAVPSEAARVDPSNELPSRMNRRRMTIEQWRDSLLFATATLQPPAGRSMELTDAANFQRTVYARISRLQLNDVLTQFDYPDANVHAEKRSVTNTPMQKLFVLNSPFVIRQAKLFSARLTAEGIEDDDGRVTRAYRLLFARDPSGAERVLANEFLHETDGSAMTRWQQYAQILMASNEAFYVD